MQWAARSSGRVRLNEPRNDFASGVRELATMTASLIESLLFGGPSEGRPGSAGPSPSAGGLGVLRGPP